MLTNCGSILSAAPSSSFSDNPPSTHGLQGIWFLSGTTCREVSMSHEDIAEGSQVMAINCYPACPEPHLTLGLPPHTDYGMTSIILQNHQGLQIMDRDKKWHSVPLIEGALIVMLGDHMEVLSNGIYKGIVHRATVNSEKKSISIVSLHSLALGKKVGPALALVNKQNILSYKEGSFNDFLDFISREDISEAKYIDKLKINP